MKSAGFLALLLVACLSGCSTPGSQYARAHPELPPAQRQILTTGTVPGGNAVEGMSKEQVRLAMGNPDRFEKFNGQDVWVYVRQKFADISPAEDPSAVYGSGPNAQRNFTETANLGPRPSVHELTAVFFRGDRATHAEISRQR